MAFRIAKGQRSPSLQGVVKIDGAAQDLTGATVRFLMRLFGSSTTKVAATATVVTAGSGIVRYDWSADDTDTAGDYVGWWEVTWSNGLAQDSPEFPVEVYEHAKVTLGLCSLPDVRSYLDKPIDDRAQDDDIKRLIRAASTSIETYAGRQFTLDTSASARLFDLTDWWDQPAVAIDDLSAVPTTALTVLDANGDTVGTLDESTDVQFLPLRRRTGEPIDSLRLRPQATTSLARSYQLSITGIWGWPAIPEDVRLAAIQQVREWWRRDMVVGSNTFSDELQTAPATPRSLSVGVKRLVDPYRTPVIG